MGGMLVNVFVRSDDQAAVVRTAKEILGSNYTQHPMSRLPERMLSLLDGDAAALLGQLLGQMGRGPQADPEAPIFFVSPAVNGWVGVHDSSMQSQSTDLCVQVATGLSERLQTSAITFLIHDGDFLCYWLARNGVLIDEYNSMPDYFGGAVGADEESEDGLEGWSHEGAPTGGYAAVLSEACGVPEKEHDIDQILRNPEADAYGLLDRLGDALGITDSTVDFDLLTYQPLQGAVDTTIPVSERDRYVEVRRKELTS